MDEYVDLINQIDNILNTSENIDNENDKKIFFEQHLAIFENFKNALPIILRNYQFTEQGNNEQNILVEKVQNAISKLLGLKDVFKKDSQYEYFKAGLIDALNYNENKFAFSLQYETSIDKVKAALQYLNDRKAYVQILEDNILFSEQGLNESSTKEYISNNYEQNMFGHALILLKNNFLNLSKEDITELLQYIDNSDFFTTLITKDYKKMNFYEQNLIYQYSDTILKMKSIFVPEELKNDKLITEMWNGKIIDNKTLQNILQNISPASFMDLLEYEPKTSEKGFIFDLARHFKNINLPDKNISAIIKSIFDTKKISYETARFLAEIDIPTDYSQFMDDEHSTTYSWLTDYATFDSLKSIEKDIEDAKGPFLPVDYYLKKLDKLYESPNVSTHFVGNLITLLHSDYYSPEEKETLTNALKQQNLYSDFITEDEITFDKNDSTETTILKVKQAYLSGKPIPLDLAQTLLNNDLSGNYHIDKETLQACVQGVVCNNLSNKGIDIQNKLLFGQGHGINLGYNDPSNKAIWIDDSLLELYLTSQNLSDKAKLFETMFHEMQHSVQIDNIEKGKIDYLTYNFIKEDVIEEYDPNFYDDNYTNIFMESDARKEEILGALEFLNGMNPDFVKVIKTQMENKYVAESEKHTLYGDSKKKISIGKNTLIDISDYVGLLIQNNPKILTENPILNIEYNQNGSRKSIEELLNSFEEQKNLPNTDYKSLYSIYYGLLSKSLENTPIENEDLRQQIDSFMNEQQELVSMEDMQNYYHSVDKSNIRQLYSRLYDITHSEPSEHINVEYNQNGSKKSIEELLNSFEEQTSLSPTESERLHSIYSDIIMKRLESSPITNEDLSERISAFLKYHQRLEDEEVDFYDDDPR